MKEPIMIDTNPTTRWKHSANNYVLKFLGDARRGDVVIVQFEVLESTTDDNPSGTLFEIHYAHSTLWGALIGDMRMHPEKAYEVYRENRQMYLGKSVEFSVILETTPSREWFDRHEFAPIQSPEELADEPEPTLDELRLGVIEMFLAWLVRTDIPLPAEHIGTNFNVQRKDDGSIEARITVTKAEVIDQAVAQKRLEHKGGFDA